ncbi:MAG: hypothetical protein AB1689_10560 [Thermodesulfobacteriota bacterium]
MTTRLARIAAQAACTGLAVTLFAGPAGATGAAGAAKGQPRIGGHVVGVAPMPMLRNPAGPTPLNPAGPTPLNPAGPTPLNPVGPSIPFPRSGVVIVPQPGVHVGIVGQQEPVGLPLGSSFYCQVHDRGYASQSLFFDHLAVADGLAGDEALSYLVDDGGVWVFPAE